MILILFFFFLFVNITKGDYVTLVLSPDSVQNQDRTTSNAVCSTTCVGENDAWAMLTFRDSNVATWGKFGANPLTGVYVSGNYIGTMNDLFFGTLSQSMSSADPLMDTGNFAAGGVVNTAFCPFGPGDWSASASSGYKVGSPIGLTNILEGFGPFCSFIGFGVSLRSNQFYCMCYFTGSVFPTKNPTKKPTTRSPTKSPTKNPTIHPTTLQPTQNPTLFNGQLRMVKLKKGSQIQVRKPIQYEEGIPTKVEFIQAGEFEEVILYTNVDWFLDGVAQPQLPQCLPLPNILPGTLYESKCPCLEKCTSIAPYLQNGVLKYTTLRCCLQSWVETTLPPTGESFPSQAWVFNASITSDPPPPPPVTYGVIHCNNPIERELNCQFWRQNPSTYTLQCANEPITCYQNDTLGYAFGLFWDRNPNFPYTGVLEEGQLRGIASILNFKHYSLNGKWADPLNPELMNRYYWLENTVITSNWTFEVVVMPDIIQSRPQNWLLNLFSTQNLDPTACLSSFSSPLCDILTWQNLTDQWWKLPGVWIIPKTNLSTFPVTWLYEGMQANGVEVWKSGALIYQNLTKSTSYSIPVNSQTFPMQIRLLIGSIWDIPSGQSSPSVPFLPDSLWSSVNMGYLQFPYIQLVKTQCKNPSICAQEGDFPYQNNTPIINITLSLQYGTQPDQWSSLSEKILIENIYPLNKPLLEDEPLYTVRPINYTEDREYLIKIWSTHLARRHVSEDGDCRTYDLGGLEFYSPNPEYTQPWFQTPDQIIPQGSRAGGCRCQKGEFLTLRDPLTQCGTCFDGFGPPDDCKKPFSNDPIPGNYPGICANHGVVNESIEKKNETLYIYSGQFSLCDKLIYNERTFQLIKNVSQGEAYLFINGEDEFVILKNDQIFYNLIPLPTTITQLKPTIWKTSLGVLECAGGAYDSSGILLNPPLDVSPSRGTFRRYLFV
jgi:hypothetical protein